MKSGVLGTMTDHIQSFEKKYIFEFQITQQDGTSVRWEGHQNIQKIREIVEVELKKLE
jgi:hypothetical protein